MNVELALESFTYNNELGYFELMMKCLKFPSVNDMYGINTRRENKRMYLLPHVEEYKSQLKDQIVLTDPKKYCPWITHHTVYSLTLVFLLKTGYWNRDLDNMIKPTQDTLFECFSMNDSKVIEGHQYKAMVEDEFEYIILKLALSRFNYKQFL